MNCKYLKQKLNHKLECKLNNKIITLKDCKNCKYKEYQIVNINKMKTKSNKLAKLEKNRISLFTDDLEHCFICGKLKDHLHEIFFGSNRLNSIKYKLVIPICFECHSKIHNNIELQKEWYIKGQKKFNEIYPDLNFIEIFKKNWLN